jgi:hypothetical protein
MHRRHVLIKHPHHALLDHLLRLHYPLPRHSESTPLFTDEP